MKGKMEKAPNHFVVVSYAPLLWPEPDLQEPIDPSDTAKLEKILKQITVVRNDAKAVAWTTDHEPVFLMKQAVKIAEHMRDWSEGKPKDWFKVNWAKHDNGRYVLTIQPRYKPSLERFRARLAMYGIFASPEDKYTMLFRPIFFESKEGSTAFDRLKMERWSARVGFIQNLKDKPYWLDTFEITRDQTILNLIKDSK
jgi:hypothetical protein